MGRQAAGQQGCVAGQSRCQWQRAGRARERRSRVCSTVSGAVAAAPAAPASWRCQSPCRPLRNIERGIQGEPDTSPWRQSKSLGFELSGTLLTTKQQPCVVDLRGGL